MVTINVIANYLWNLYLFSPNELVRGTILPELYKALRVVEPLTRPANDPLELFEKTIKYVITETKFRDLLVLLKKAAEMKKIKMKFYNQYKSEALQKDLPQLNTPAVRYAPYFMILDDTEKKVMSLLDNILVSEDKQSLREFMDLGGDLNLHDPSTLNFERKATLITKSRNKILSFLLRRKTARLIAITIPYVENLKNSHTMGIGTTLR